ncbi:MAG: hypothetical protein NTW20_04090 [Rhodobacterales bacterium]|nr:hypothetical protein [Rhodobacterales bacterium]
MRAGEVKESKEDQVATIAVEIRQMNVAKPTQNGVAAMSPNVY